ncbi:42456_t:CDS:2 [Gigaspora margarita]|uniref:42456_t:CDS:1 n=1 Tax=Gigaspora margarita TaxID=4874 RepID=A0ABM8VZI0_GIGMA|nr:42456_t:CDS:2 [Gigaspora margarita]
MNSNTYFSSHATTANSDPIYDRIFTKHLAWIGFDIKNKKDTFSTDENTKLYTTPLVDIIFEAHNSNIGVYGTIFHTNELLQKLEETNVIEDEDLHKRYKNKINPTLTMMDAIKSYAANNFVITN